MEGLWKLNAGAELVTVNSEDNLGAGRPWLIELPNDYKTPLAISQNLKYFLNESDYDIYHANALWMYQCHITAKVARQKGRPYIISPHGMLYPTALKIKRWKKWPMLKLWFSKDIHSASCLRLTRPRAVASYQKAHTSSHRDKICGPRFPSSRSIGAVPKGAFSRLHAPFGYGCPAECHSPPSSLSLPQKMTK
jgi:hypothetical protein